MVIYRHSAPMPRSRDETYGLLDVDRPGRWPNVSVLIVRNLS